MTTALVTVVAEVVLGGLLHLLKDHRRDLGRRVALALDLDGGDVVLAGDDLIRNALDLVLDLAHLAAHEALDGKDRVLRVGDGLTLGDLTDETLAVLREADDRWGRATALGVGDDDRVAAFHDRDDGVRRSEIDANDFVGHCFLNRDVKWRVAGVACARSAARDKARWQDRISAPSWQESRQLTKRAWRQRWLSMPFTADADAILAQSYERDMIPTQRREPDPPHADHDLAHPRAPCSPSGWSCRAAGSPGRLSAGDERLQPRDGARRADPPSAGRDRGSDHADGSPASSTAIRSTSSRR